MKLHLIAAASIALLCSASIGSVEAQAIESHQEESFPEQAWNYKVETKHDEILAEKGKKTPRPTKKPKKTRRPTPRPTRRPTVSRRQANRLIARKWTDDECAMSRRRQSTRCRDLNQGVCSMSERKIIRRFSKQAVKVCDKVGFAPKTEYYDNMYELVESFESEPISEDEDYDYDAYAATTSTKSSKGGSYDYNVYAANSSTNTKSDKGGSYDYDYQ